MKVVVVLVWATKKRHIAVDGEVLCKPKHTNNIRQRGANGYNSLTVHGIPDKKHIPDTSCHHDGQIEFLPLDEQKTIIQSSICEKCKTKYKKLISQARINQNGYIKNTN